MDRTRPEYLSYIAESPLAPVTGLFYLSGELNSARSFSERAFYAASEYFQLVPDADGATYRMLYAIQNLDAGLDINQKYFVFPLDLGRFRSLLRFAVRGHAVPARVRAPEELAAQKYGSEGCNHMHSVFCDPPGCDCQ